MLSTPLFFMASVTKQLLRMMGCDVPGCTNCAHQIYLSSKCHPEAGFMILFDKHLDTLIVICEECKGFVANIAVEEEEYHLPEKNRGTRKAN